MAAPALLAASPANGNSGFPIGEYIVLSFDRGVDLISAQNNIVLYGRDFDQTSGSDSVLFIDQDTGNNPNFLRSPGFNGLVDLSITATYYDIDSDADITSDFESESDEAAYSTGGAGHRLYVRPRVGAFAPDTEYKLHILGDPDSVGTGISSRTVFAVVPDAGNASDTGIVHAGGSFTGDTADTVNVEITQAGDVGTAKYKWWYQSAGVGSAVYDKLSNRKFRNLANGVQIRFTGEGFALGDTFTFAVEPATRLATNTKIVFTTNDGSYSDAPDTPSLPATSQPPATVIPDVPGASTESDSLQVVSMTPDDGAYNVSVNTRTIHIEFSDLLDATTITDDSVSVYVLPALGWYEGQAQPRELQKKLTVNGDILTIEF